MLSTDPSFLLSARRRFTHYFYNVLKAQYTFPSHRLNDVPICLYFATHFYFSSYHTFSNCVLRYSERKYESGVQRTVLYVGVILVLSYFTAFMETLTISSFPYYSFEDPVMAYVAGSAFYGIYFIFSFPMFYQFDNYIDNRKTKKGVTVTVWDTVVYASGCGMLILTTLDFVRLLLGIKLCVA